MITKYLFKDAFAVIGKAGQGAANNPQEWILPLWDDANAHFTEVVALAKKSEDGTPQIWGAMNDAAESNKRWDEETGKYMAGCETDVDAVPPAGWTKWVIPAQTYLIVETTMDQYGKVFGKITTDPQIQIVATAHERYPQPRNPNVVKIWFPIVDGMMFCQSCAMPLTKPEDFGKETDGSVNHDYCCHCYEGGSLGGDMTMEEMIEICIPFCRDHYESDEAARAHMMSFFPKLKRWRNDEYEANFICNRNAK